MFEIYTKEVEIKGEKYKLRPLSGRFLPLLYQVMSVFDEITKESGENKDMLKAFDEKTTTNLHIIAMETFKKSYPDVDEVALDEFISQNLMTVIESIFTVNMPESSEKEKE